MRNCETWASRHQKAAGEWQNFLLHRTTASAWCPWMHSVRVNPLSRSPLPPKRRVSSFFSFLCLFVGIWFMILLLVEREERKIREEKRANAGKTVIRSQTRFLLLFSSVFFLLLSSLLSVCIPSHDCMASGEGKAIDRQKNKRREEDANCFPSVWVDACEWEEDVFSLLMFAFSFIPWLTWFSLLRIPIVNSNFLLWILQETRSESFLIPCSLPSFLLLLRF